MSISKLMFGIGDIDLVKEKLNETAKICIEMIEDLEIWYNNLLK